MKLDEVLGDPTTAWLTMERYVNDGSPSGITTTTSDRTSPTGPFAHFQLPFYSCPEVTVRSAGHQFHDPDLPAAAFPVHPDIDPATEGGLPADHAPITVDTVRVTPTSSGRSSRIRFRVSRMSCHVSPG